MEEILLPPNASALVESMRDIGYSFESAVADLIDNSITADAGSVDIHFGLHGGNPYIAIIDDGRGMSEEVLHEAMRPGSKDPRELRSPDDLGRFGLGLKTASFSQCRRLSVVTAQDGVVHARRWDLDIVAARNEWVLLTLDAADIATLPKAELLGQKGTIVIWEVLDRLVHGLGPEEWIASMNSSMEVLQKHLELVFHRFLSGEQGVRRLTLRINGHELAPFDPFGTKYPATTQMVDEEIRLSGALIRLTAYILPHHSKITPKDYETLGGSEGYVRSQGFYVYRNKRLIVYATWFRLAKQLELTKLARVKVDIPNTLDHLWTLDVKKSRASPPEMVRKELRRIIDRITGQSTRVYTFRGRKLTGDEIVHVWERILTRDSVTYRINRAHPLIAGLAVDLAVTELGTLEDALSLIEGAFPTDAFFADAAGTDARLKQPSEDPVLFDRLISAAIGVLRDGGLSDAEIAKHLLEMEPFCAAPDATKAALQDIGIRGEIQ